MAPIRVYLVEDQPRLLRGLERALARRPGLEVVGAALDGETALAEIAEAGPPDVLVLDLELPGLSGLDVLGRLGQMDVDVEVLVWTAFQDEERVFEAIRGGASGYLLKNSPPDRIEDGIVEVYRGGTVLEPVIARRFLNLFRSLGRGGAANDCPLTEEEREVLQVVGRGLSNREAGDVLDLTRRRVRSHLRRIYRKLEVRGRVEAVTRAVSRGWIEL